MMNKVLVGIMVVFYGMLNAQGLVTKSDDQKADATREKVEAAVIEWASATLDDYNEPRFEKYHADYTDEYTMASLREKSLEDNIRRLEKQKEKGTYNGSEEDYRKAMEVLVQRKKEAAEALENFHPKVKNYTISFWANVRLDSGVHNYIEFKMVVDDYFNLVSHEVISQIGDNKNANIVYKSKD